MIVKDIYDRVNKIVAISQPDFLHLLNNCLDRLTAKYGEEYVYDGKTSSAGTIEDNITVHKEWLSCIIDYIIYNKLSDDQRKADFETGCDYTYRTIWRKKLKKHKYPLPDWR